MIWKFIIFNVSKIRLQSIGIRRLAFEASNKLISFQSNLYIFFSNQCRHTFFNPIQNMSFQSKLRYIKILPYPKCFFSNKMLIIYFIIIQFQYIKIQFYRKYFFPIQSWYISFQTNPDIFHSNPILIYFFPNQSLYISF